MIQKIKDLAAMPWELGIGFIKEAQAKAVRAASRAQEVFSQATKTVAETDYYMLLSDITRCIKRPLDRFQQITTEANYHAEPRNFWSLVFGRKRELPDTTTITVGEKMLGGSKMFRNRFVWTAIFAALSTHTLVAAMVVMAVVGSGFFALEYHRAKKDREDTIDEVNFAGQHVRGKRADLCRLHHAQIGIMNLSSAFRQASLESTGDTITRLMASAEDERKRIKVLDPGPYGALENTYDFSRPQISLVDKDGRAEPSALHKGWRSRKFQEREVVDQLIALQNSFSPEMKRRFMREVKRVG